MEKLISLENRYAEILDANNWVEPKTEEVEKLKSAFNKLAKENNIECMECDRLAEIDCQFH